MKADNRHPHFGAIYRAIGEADGTYCVEVTIPGSPLVKVRGFATDVRAADWISEHKSEVECGTLKRKKLHLWKNPKDAPGAQG